MKEKRQKNKINEPVSHGHSRPLSTTVGYGIVAVLVIFSLMFGVLWFVQGSPAHKHNRHLAQQVSLPPKLQKTYADLSKIIGSQKTDKLGNTYIVNGVYLRDFHEYT